MRREENEMNDTFLRACRREPTSYTPVWLMRQAGRYQVSYREIRAKYTMLELCQHPEEVARVTLLPVEQFHVDSAILFSDITIPFLGMKVAFDIVPGVGPVIEEPIRCPADVSRLTEFPVADELPFITEAISILKKELHIPLIGFAGAPFTLAAYLIEGKPSKDFKHVRQFMFQYPEAWRELMDLLVKVTVDYLGLQARAGADALQLFDSWVGALHPVAYERYLFSHMKVLFDEVAKNSVPMIHFGTGTASLLPLMHRAGGDVIGIDWRTPLAESWERLGFECAVQGNLDPAILFCDRARITEEVDRILAEAGGRPGHIFNLGHGVLPGTPEENVKFLVDYVHEKSAR